MTTKSNKPPYLPLWVGDYLRDTQHLTNEEHGAYLRLLMHAWTVGGIIPKDDKRLAILLGISLSKWRNLKPMIMPFWHEHESGYEQKRLTQELDATREISDKRRNAANARWHASADASASPVHMQNACTQSQSHKPPINHHPSTTNGDPTNHADDDDSKREKVKAFLKANVDHFHGDQERMNRFGRWCMTELKTVNTRAMTKALENWQ